MNRYPVWKYAIIVIVLLVGLIYSLPNFFGEAPAVQVSAAKSTVKVDAATQSRVEEALKLVSRSPAWLTALHAFPMYLGLDLRGGVDFLLQVDMKGAIDKKAESFASDLRTGLRDKGVRGSAVNRVG